jgi:hypothetical protein
MFASAAPTRSGATTRSRRLKVSVKRLAARFNLVPAAPETERSPETICLAMCPMYPHSTSIQRAATSGSMVT